MHPSRHCWQVEVAATFKYKSCVKELLKIYPMKIHRGVRLKWCYYPLGTKYDLIYRRGDMVQLVHRYILQWTRFGGDKVKTIRKWHPSINMVWLAQGAGVGGWCVARAVAGGRFVVLSSFLRSEKQPTFGMALESGWQISGFLCGYRVVGLLW